MSPQKSKAQSEARQDTGTPERRQSVTRRIQVGDGDALTQSERHTSSDDVSAEADDVSNNSCAVASDKGSAVEADWETSMEADWVDDDVDDADLLNQNEAEEEEEPWLCAKRRKLWRDGTPFVKPDVTSYVTSYLLNLWCLNQWRLKDC